MAQYGKLAYWDDRYSKDQQPFDWYQRYSGIKHVISENVQKDSKVLMAGCGSSRLSEDMHDDGFTDIANIDVSRVVIDQMKARYQDRPQLSWTAMDVTSLEHPDEFFDCVIAKGTVDAILCGEGSTANMAEMCKEVSRVLAPNGVFIIVSYGAPDNRRDYLEQEEYGWTVRETITVPKPQISTAAAVDAKDATSVHYIYICEKPSGEED